MKIFEYDNIVRGIVFVYYVASVFYMNLKELKENKYVNLSMSILNAISLVALDYTRRARKNTSNQVIQINGTGDQDNNHEINIINEESQNTDSNHEPIA